MCPLLSEIFFYYTHKAGHISFVYRHVHKVHHKWSVTCAVAASYAHSLEFLLCFVPVLVLPPVIVNLHWTATQLWWCLALISVVGSHSGYTARTFPWTLLGAEPRHSEHHMNGKVKFGPLQLLDKIYGTEELGESSILHRTVLKRKSS